MRERFASRKNVLNKYSNQFCVVMCIFYWLISFFFLCKFVIFFSTHTQRERESDRSARELFATAWCRSYDGHWAMIWALFDVMTTANTHTNKLILAHELSLNFYDRFCFFVFQTHSFGRRNVFSRNMSIFWCRLWNMFKHKVDGI